MHIAVNSEHRDVDAQCSEHHQLVSVLFWPSVLNAFLLKNLFSYLFPNGLMDPASSIFLHVPNSGQGFIQDFRFGGSTISI